MPFEDDISVENYLFLLPAVSPELGAYNLGKKLSKEHLQICQNISVICFNIITKIKC
jgi:hypothetical protein